MTESRHLSALRSRPVQPGTSIKLALGALLVCLGLNPSNAAAAVATTGNGLAPLVAAASDTKFALDEIVERYRAGTGITARVAYGSSGNFARQIARGAPYQIFLSADEQFIDDLHEQGLTRGTGDLYAIGRIVVFAPAGSPLTPDPRLDELARRLAAGGIARFAIANPEHAPYGRAAEQALRARGIWDALRPRLVLGENAAQAAQFASSGDTEGGIVAYALALSPELRRRGTFALIPDSMHAPLRQRMVLLKPASPAAEQFYEYLRSPASREILARHGLSPPAE